MSDALRLLIPLLSLTAMTLCVSATASADQARLLGPFVPTEATTLVGIDLEPKGQADFTPLARLYIEQHPDAARLLGWMKDTKVPNDPSAALLIEDAQGRAAVLLQMPELRDSHWLRIKSLLQAHALVSIRTRGAEVWGATGATAEKLPGADRMAVARLNDSTLAVGDIELVKSAANNARNRRLARALDAALYQIPQIATVWFVRLPPNQRAAQRRRRRGQPAPEAAPKGPCTEGASGFAVLDDGLLFQARLQCESPQEAQTHIATLTKDLQDDNIGQELAGLPGAHALLKTALLQRVGDDIMLVITADAATTGRLLDGMTDGW